jgi:aspartate-semialdehyde dehydrogenase
MWNVKAEVIPVILGATGTVSKSLRQYLRNVRGKHEIKELQKSAVLGTAGSANVRYCTNSTYLLYDSYETFEYGLWTKCSAGGG